MKGFFVRMSWRLGLCVGLMLGDCVLLVAMEKNEKVDEMALEESVVNIANEFGNTPLHRAANNGDDEAVAKLLADKKIDVNLYNKHGYTSLHLAVLGEHAAIVQLLLDDDRCEVNRKDENFEMTPLHCAACLGNKRIGLMLLLVDGIEICVKDKAGMTPAMCAEKHEHEDMAAVLKSDDVAYMCETLAKQIQTAQHEQKAITQRQKKCIKCCCALQ